MGSDLSRQPLATGYLGGMRTALIALAFVALAAPATAADDLPTGDCSRAFLSRWAADRDAAFKNMPKRPCWMRTGTGPYVCSKDGCVRAAVYFGGGA